MKTQMTFGKKLLSTALMAAALALAALPLNANATEYKETWNTSEGEPALDFYTSDLLGIRDETYDFGDGPETVSIYYFKPGSVVRLSEHEGVKYSKGIDTGHNGRFGSFSVNALFKKLDGMGEFFVPVEYSQNQKNDNTTDTITFTLNDCWKDLHIDSEFSGRYMIYGNISVIEGEYNWSYGKTVSGIEFKIVDELPEGVTPVQVSNNPTAPTKTEVTSHNANLLVNGTSSAFEAYEIEGNNYFKLRDLAKVLSGTDKQFEVSWDAEKNAINLVSGKAYTIAGGELAKADGSSKEAELNTSKIYLDGKELSLTAYTIGGSNYFKLRDLGQAVDFAVGWDSASSTIQIDTTKGYTAE